MTLTLTPYYKRIVRQQIAAGRFANEGEVIRHSLRLADALERNAGPRGCAVSGGEELEALLLEGLASGPSVRMTAGRKKNIYRQALGTK
jgi:putative addiction module CopG family antidote